MSEAFSQLKAVELLADIVHNDLTIGPKFARVCVTIPIAQKLFPILIHERALAQGFLKILQDIPSPTYHKLGIEIKHVLKFCLKLGFIRMNCTIR